MPFDPHICSWKVKHLGMLLITTQPLRINLVGAHYPWVSSGAPKTWDRAQRCLGESLLGSKVPRTDLFLSNGWKEPNSSVISMTAGGLYLSAMGSSELLHPCQLLGLLPKVSNQEADWHFHAGGALLTDTSKKSFAKLYPTIEKILQSFKQRWVNQILLASH